LNWAEQIFTGAGSHGSEIARLRACLKLADR
jgi:hypothetical protein